MWDKFVIMDDSIQILSRVSHYGFAGFTDSKETWTSNPTRVKLYDKIEDATTDAQKLLALPIKILQYVIKDNTVTVKEHKFTLAKLQEAALNVKA